MGHLPHTIDILHTTVFIQIRRSATYVDNTMHTRYQRRTTAIWSVSQSCAKVMWLSVRRQNSALSGSMSVSCARAQVGPLASSLLKRFMEI